MTLPAARMGDACVVHCKRPYVAAGSDNVIINGLAAARLGDPVTPHEMPASPSCVTHPSAIAVGSSTVFINARPAAYLGSKLVACTAVAMGSPNVFVQP